MKLDLSHFQLHWYSVRVCERATVMMTGDKGFFASCWACFFLTLPVVYGDLSYTVPEEMRPQSIIGNIAKDRSEWRDHIGRLCRFHTPTKKKKKTVTSVCRLCHSGISEILGKQVLNKIAYC